MSLHDADADPMVATPGEIYRFMAVQFRAERAEGHNACLMPPVAFDAEGNLSPRLDTATPCCANCQALALEIVERLKGRIVAGMRPSGAMAANEANAERTEAA